MPQFDGATFFSQVLWATLLFGGLHFTLCYYYLPWLESASVAQFFLKGTQISDSTSAREFKEIGSKMNAA
jgi:hypothetical protein